MTGNKDSENIVGIDEFCQMLELSRNAVIKAIKEDRIKSAYKDKDDRWKFDADRCLMEYHENTRKGKSRNFDEGDEGGGYQVTDAQIANRRSVLSIPEDKWTLNEANQAEAIFDALEAKLRYEAKQGKFYPKESTDKKFKDLTKLFADGLKKLPEELRQRHPDLDKKVYKTLEKLIDDTRKAISGAL